MTRGARTSRGTPATLRGPGSVIEFLNLIGPLTDPRAHGIAPSIAFDLVIPSLPGFAFSAPLQDRGWGSRRTAAAWATLMRRLGYQRYGAGDFSGVRRFAERDHKNLVQWTMHPEPGGHYAAHLEPDVLADDIRGFYREHRC